MPARRVTGSKSQTSRSVPARTPEARENELIALSMDVAERQLREGTASSQVITHFLKIGSSDAAVERMKKEKEMELMDQKKEMMASANRMEELMVEAISAFRAYSGNGELEAPADFDDYED